MTMQLPLIAHRFGRWVTRSWPQAPGMWRVRHLLSNHRAVRFACDSVDVKLFNGTLLTVDPNDLIGRTIFYGGLWEGPVARHFVEHLRAGDVVLDIGANLGQFTLLASRAVGDSGKVIAVEASPSMALRLRRNIRQNSAANVSVLEMAAWDEEATVWLDSGVEGNEGMAAAHDIANGAGVTPVRARRLDDALADMQIELVDVIKIDIEGAELRAFRGLERVIQNKPPRLIYCEVFAETAESLPSAQELVQQILGWGYGGQRVDTDGMHGFDASHLQPGFLETLVFTQGERP